MSIGLEDATVMLRRQLLAGEYPPGIKLSETAVAEKLNVSRTIVRLAMSELEHEGLLTRQPNRGSRIRAFSIDEVAQAIEVRGEMEAVAVRLAAERGLDAARRAELESLITEGDGLLAAGTLSEGIRAAWIDMNSRFHDSLLEASGNWALRGSITHISKLPLVSASALIFDQNDIEKGMRQIARSHLDHQDILSAVLRRQGSRAASLMREHAFRSAQHKRENLVDPTTMAAARQLPGGALVIPAEPERKAARRTRRVKAHEADEAGEAHY